MVEYLKHLLVRTPLEGPLQRLRWLAGAPRRRRHPELADIYLESDRIDDMLRRVVRPDSNCIDVGCHLGSFLSQLTRLAPRGRHTAVEAIPHKAAWLRQKFPEVAVEQVAVGSEPGEVTFYRNVTRSGFSGLNVHADPSDKVEAITVRCARLDDLAPADRPVDFVKIDVEGAELSVLQGAEGLLTRSRPTLLFECTHDGLASAGTTAEALFDFLAGRHGYGIFLLKDWLAGGAPLTAAAFRQAMKYPFQAFNFLAAPIRAEGTAATTAA